MIDLYMAYELRMVAILQNVSLKKNQKEAILWHMKTKWNSNVSYHKSHFTRT